MTQIGSPLADGSTVALSSAQLDELPATIPRVPVEHVDATWTWIDPNGLKRSIPDSWALPRLRYERRPADATTRYGHGPDRTRGLVCLIPPAGA